MTYYDRQILMDRIIEVRHCDIEEEQRCCYELLEIAKRGKDTYGMAFAYTYLGDYFIAANDTIQCGACLRQAQLICMENGYRDLLIAVYNLMGVSYEAIADEQTALQNYLQALQLMQGQNCPDKECIVFNNIASNFDKYGDYEEAEKYYLRSIAALERVTEDVPNFGYVKLRVWSNFADTYCSMGEYEKMKEYIDLCEQQVGRFDLVKEYLLCFCWCGYYSGLQETERAAGYAEKLIQLVEQRPYDDKYLIYEILDAVFDVLLAQHSYSYADRILEVLWKLCGPEEMERMRRNQLLNVRYCEVAGTEQDRMGSYRDYYRVMSEAEKETNRAKVRGLKNILYLEEIKNTLTIEKLNLADEAHLDELTRLYNRRYFNKLLSKTVEDANVKQLALIMVDVDYFKEYNDTYGHAKGDGALVAVAVALKSVEAPRASAARYGGDEFIVVLTNPEVGEVEALTARIRAMLAQQSIEHKASHCSDKLTLSIGVSAGNVGADAQFVSELLEKADQALYVSKAAGRNTVTILPFRKELEQARVT